MTTAAINASDAGSPNGQAKRQVPLPLRGDTLLGVCEGIGEELGFNPNWLRVALAALLLWNWPVVVAVYLGLGAVLALTRWFLPDPAKNAAAEDAVENSDGMEEEERLAA